MSGAGNWNAWMGGSQEGGSGNTSPPTYETLTTNSAVPALSTNYHYLPPNASHSNPYPQQYSHSHYGQQPPTPYDASNPSYYPPPPYGTGYDTSSTANPMSQSHPRSADASISHAAYSYIPSTVSHAPSRKVHKIRKKKRLPRALSRPPSRPPKPPKTSSSSTLTASSGSNQSNPSIHTLPSSELSTATSGIVQHSASKSYEMIIENVPPRIRSTELRDALNAQKCHLTDFYIPDYANPSTIILVIKGFIQWRTLSKLDVIEIRGVRCPIKPKPLKTLTDPVDDGNDENHKPKSSIKTKDDAVTKVTDTVTTSDAKVILKDDDSMKKGGYSSKNKNTIDLIQSPKDTVDLENDKKEKEKQSVNDQGNVQHPQSKSTVTTDLDLLAQLDALSPTIMASQSGSKSQNTANTGNTGNTGSGVTVTHLVARGVKDEPVVPVGSDCNVQNEDSDVMKPPSIAMRMVSVKDPPSTSTSTLIETDVRSQPHSQSKVIKKERISDGDHEGENGKNEMNTKDEGTECPKSNDISPSRSTDTKSTVSNAAKDTVSNVTAPNAVHTVNAINTTESTQHQSVKAESDPIIPIDSEKKTDSIKSGKLKPGKTKTKCILPISPVNDCGVSDEDTPISRRPPNKSKDDQIDTEISEVMDFDIYKETAKTSIAEDLKKIPDVDMTGILEDEHEMFSMGGMGGMESMDDNHDIDPFIHDHDPNPDDHDRDGQSPETFDNLQQLMMAEEEEEELMRQKMVNYKMQRQQRHDANSTTAISIVSDGEFNDDIDPNANVNAVDAVDSGQRIVEPPSLEPLPDLIQLDHTTTDEEVEEDPIKRKKNVFQPMTVDEKKKRQKANLRKALQQSSSLRNNRKSEAVIQSKPAAINPMNRGTVSHSHSHSSSSSSYQRSPKLRTTRSPNPVLDLNSSTERRRNNLNALNLLQKRKSITTNGMNSKRTNSPNNKSKTKTLKKSSSKMRKLYSMKLEKHKKPSIPLSRDSSSSIAHSTRSMFMSKLIEQSMTFHVGMPLLQFKTMALRIEDIMKNHCTTTTTYKLSCGQVLRKYKSLRNLHKLEQFIKDNFASEKYPKKIKAQTPLERLLLTRTQLEQNGYPLKSKYMDAEYADFVEIPQPGGTSGTRTWSNSSHHQAGRGRKRQKKRKQYELLALDCEMCQTTKGSELTRISIVDSKCMVVYDKLVKPSNPITDYLTQWSGITPALMKDVTLTIEDVHDEIFEFMDSDTILCGHSLENDLIAMKVFHYKVVDTAVLYMKQFKFRNKRRNIGFIGSGGGRKVSLKALCKQYLNKSIQSSKGPDGQIVGHSSVEDAIAAMQLLQLQLKWEESRNRKLGISVPDSMTQFAVYDEEKTNSDSVKMGNSTNPQIDPKSGKSQISINQKSSRESQRREEMMKKMAQKKKEIMLYSRNPRMAMKQKRERMRMDSNRKRPREGGTSIPGQGNSTTPQRMQKRRRIDSSKMRYNPHRQTQQEISGGNKPKLPAMSKEEMLSSLFGEEPKSMKKATKVVVTKQRITLNQNKTKPPLESIGSTVSRSSDPFAVQSDDDSSEEMAIMSSIKSNKSTNKSNSNSIAKSSNSVRCDPAENVKSKTSKKAAIIKSEVVMEDSDKKRTEPSESTKVSKPSQSMKATIMIGGKAVEIDLQPDVVQNLLASKNLNLKNEDLVEDTVSIPPAMKEEPIANHPITNAPPPRGTKRKLDELDTVSTPQPTKKVKCSVTKLQTRKTTPRTKPQMAVRSGGPPLGPKQRNDETADNVPLNIACDSHSASSIGGEDEHNQSDSEHSVRSRSPSFSPSPAFSEQLQRISSVLGIGDENDDEIPPPPPPMLNALNASSSDSDQRRKRKERKKKLRKKAKRKKKKRKEKKERKHKSKKEAKKRKIFKEEMVQISNDPTTATAPRLTPTPVSSRYEYQYKAPTHSSGREEGDESGSEREKEKGSKSSKSKTRSKSSKSSNSRKEFREKAKNTVLEWCHEYLTPYFKAQKITRKEYSAICKKSVDKIVGSHSKWTETHLKTLQTKERKKAMVLIKAYYKKHTHS